MHVDKAFLLLVRNSSPYSGEVILLLVSPFSPLKSMGKLITFESSNTYRAVTLWLSLHSENTRSKRLDKYRTPTQDAHQADPLGRKSPLYLTLLLLSP